MTKSEKDRKKVPEYFINFIQTFYELLVVHSGIEFNLYDLINEHESLTLYKLASLTNISKKMINSWCNAATAIGHLKLEKNNYVLSSWAEHYLHKESPTYLGFFLQSMDDLIFLYQTLTDRFNGNFPSITGSQAISIIKGIAPLAKFIVPVLRERIPKLKEKCKVLDLGCGLGSYLVNLAKLNPQLQGIGIEGGWGSNVIKEATKYIKQNNMESQIQIIESDILKFNTEQKFDVIFMSNFIQAFKKKDVKHILNNSYNWLKYQGTIVIQENLINENGIEPQFNALFNFYLNLESPNARLYTYQELYNFLHDIKFTEIKKYEFLFGLSHVIAKK
ncbi:MAG: class I SAM-dependent methyltransferase [Candidatus Helarchaeota archaeon]